MTVKGPHYSTYYFRWWLGILALVLTLTVDLSPIEGAKGQRFTQPVFRQYTVTGIGGFGLRGATASLRGSLLTQKTAFAQEAQPLAPEALEALEIRYQKLLEQKAALLNNKRYQKRKIKRKYKHRPHIQRLRDEEQRIDQELTAIDAMAPHLKEKYAGALSPEPPGEDGAY